MEKTALRQQLQRQVSDFIQQGGKVEKFSIRGRKLKTRRASLPPLFELRAWRDRLEFQALALCLHGGQEMGLTELRTQAVALDRQLTDVQRMISRHPDRMYT